MDLIGLEIDRYHIIEKLGQGGMAVVYKAFDTRLERYVAIKIVRMDVYGPAIRERVNKRFEREAKALSNLEHPNIIAIIDYGSWQESPYLVMPFIPGGTLKDRLGKPLYWRDAIKLIIPIIDALVYAHSKGLIHRDVKPSNILISETGLPLLTDFGIAKMLEVEDNQPTLTATGVGMGTPEYMAPEQGLGKPVDGRADVYSLAVVLYEMITGNKPFSADTPLAVLMMQVNDPIPSTRKYNVRIPESLERILYKALAKDPDNRYQNMAEFGKALQGVLAEYGQRPEPKPWVAEAAPMVAEVKIAEEPKPKIREQRTTSPKPGNTPKPVEKKTESDEKKKARLPLVLLIAFFVVLVAVGGWYGVNLARNGNAKNTPTLVSFAGLPNGNKGVTATPSPTSTEFDAAIAFLAETPTETTTSTITFTSTLRPTATKTLRRTATYSPHPPSSTNTQTRTSPPSKTFTPTNTFTPRSQSSTFTPTPTWTYAITEPTEPTEPPQPPTREPTPTVP